MNSPLPRGALVAFLLAFLAAGSAFAQRVEGRLTERETGLPIPGAVIRLLTLRGDSKAGALTDASGAFTLSAPAPGRFRLRVERVGFEVAFATA